MKYIIILCLCLFVGCISSESTIRFSNPEIQMTKINESSKIETSIDDKIEIDLQKAFGNEFINITNIIDTIKILPLETKKESIFNGIKKIVISENRIYILDKNNDFLIFDKKGLFVSKIQKGQGPGEVIEIWDFTYDPQNNQIIVYDETDYLKLYDNNGSFISDQKCPIMFHEFCTLGNGFLLFQPYYLNSHLGTKANSAAIITNRELEIKHTGIPVLNYKGLVRRYPYIIKNGNETIVSQLANDTIYSISPTKISAKYVLKYDKYKADTSSYKEIEKSNKYYHCSGFLENAKTQIINLYNQKLGVYSFIRDKETGIIIGGASFSCDLFEMPLCLPAMNVYNGYFVSYTDSYTNFKYKTHLMSESDKEKLTNLSEEANPTLLFFKIKELK